MHRSIDQSINYREEGLGFCFRCFILHVFFFICIFQFLSLTFFLFIISYTRNSLVSQANFVRLRHCYAYTYIYIYMSISIYLYYIDRLAQKQQKQLQLHFVKVYIYIYFFLVLQKLLDLLGLLMLFFLLLLLFWLPFSHMPHYSSIFILNSEYIYLYSIQIYIYMCVYSFLYINQFIHDFRFSLKNTNKLNRKCNFFFCNFSFNFCAFCL